MLAGKLCLRWGIADVQAWYESLDGSHVLNFWLAFDHIEPIGLDGLDQIQMTQTANFVAANGGGARHPQEFRAFPDMSKMAESTAVRQQRESSQFE